MKKAWGFPSFPRSSVGIVTLNKTVVCEPSEMKFSELVRLLEENGFRLIREKGSIRYYGKIGVDKLVRIDFHGTKEIPVGTCHAILKASGIKKI